MCKYLLVAASASLHQKTGTQVHYKKSGAKTYGTSPRSVQDSKVQRVQSHINHPTELNRVGMFQSNSVLISVFLLILSQW